MVLAANSALADKRVALVVGNSDYRNVAMLPNPRRDAEAVAKLFKDAGFDTVVVANNVDNLDFKRAIRNFEDAVVNSDIAVVFYAGHGIEIGGVNYLIPVDAILARDRDAQDEAISIERLTESVEGAKRLRLIILDACRDNPFGKRMKRMIAVRSISPGLGKIEPSSSDTLIAYAAKAGSTAEDGEGEHSPFTTAILANLTTPGLDIRLAFGRVRDQVMEMTHNRQEPFVYGSLGGKTAALVPERRQVTPAVPAVDNTARDYDRAHEIGTKEAWQTFLATHHGNDFYDGLARAALDKLNAADEQVKREAHRAAGMVTRTVDSGTESVIARTTFWNSECNARGVTVTITKPSANGTVLVREGLNTVPGNPKFGTAGQCVGKQVMGKQIVYRSRPDFRGSDVVVYESLSDRGERATTTVTITVR